MSVDNPYRLPWKVVYERNWQDDWLVEPLCVMSIEVDCDGKTVVETDSGVYQPNKYKAEFIVKCVNEKMR